MLFITSTMISPELSVIIVNNQQSKQIFIKNHLL